MFPKMKSVDNKRILWNGFITKRVNITAALIHYLAIIHPVCLPHKLFGAETIIIYYHRESQEFRQRPDETFVKIWRGAGSSIRPKKLKYNNFENQTIWPRILLLTRMRKSEISEETKQNFRRDILTGRWSIAIYVVSCVSETEFSLFALASMHKIIIVVCIGTSETM